MNLKLEIFFNLIKEQQKPYDDHLTAAMQKKVDWIKRMTTATLTDRQKQLVEQEKDLILATENYMAVQQKIIAYLFEQLEQANAISAGHFQDKLHAEKTLMDYIEKDKHNGEIQPAA